MKIIVVFVHVLWLCVIHDVACGADQGVARDKVIYVNGSATNTTSNCGDRGNPCHTLERGLSGLQSWLTAGTGNTGTLMISEGMYNLTTNVGTTFEDVSGISIEGWSAHNDPCPVTIACAPDENVGFYFFNSTNITLRGISLTGCGRKQSSTSYSDDGYILITVTLYFLYCTNIMIERVQVLNTPGYGAVIYDSIGYNYITESNFTNNSFINGTTQSSGGGLYIEYSYCSPISSTCIKGPDIGISNVDQAKTHDGSFLIENVSFTNNLALVNAHNATHGAYILPRGKYHIALGRGGGLSIFVIGNASNIEITIKNCSFINNSALWGGGMLLEFHDISHDNRINITGCKFSGNWLAYNHSLIGGPGGGGARVAVFMFPQNESIVYNNNVTFLNCNFSNNSAYYGGGLSVYTTKTLSNVLCNKVEINSCNFTKNTARLGAALDMSLFHPSVNGSHPKFRIIDCSFHNNYAHEAASVIGVGSVYIDSLPVTIGGQNNSFKQNKGSALAITRSCLTIEENAKLLFLENTGKGGAAIMLYSGAFIITSPGSLLNFTRNKADFFGGAIHSSTLGEREIFSSGNCFIRYSDIFVEPHMWTSTFIFDSNTANNKINAIFASSILPCVWGGSHGSTDQSLSSVFCWDNKTWIYKNSTGRMSCHLQITSGASHIYNQSSYSFIPGQSRYIDISVTDDMSNTNTDQIVFLARIVNGSASFAGHHNKSYDYTYISHNSFMIQGEPNTIATVQFMTSGSVGIERYINITLQPCPPGFVSSKESASSVCKCDEGYGGLVQCDPKALTSSIRRHTWMGSIEGHDGLVCGSTPYIAETNQSSQFTLPPNSSDLDTFFCNTTHSTGTLCASCQAQYGVAINDAYGSGICVKCSYDDTYYNWVLYILLNFLPITIFFAVIFIFSMTVTFGPLNSFIFFAQMMTTMVIVSYDNDVDDDAWYDTLKYIYIVPYDIWNLNFFQFLTSFFCLSPHLNRLDVLCLQYLEAVYPLLLLIVVVSIMTLYNRGTNCIVCLCRPFHRCLARFRQLTNLRQSLTGGIAVFIVISYTKFNLVSLYILSPQPLHNSTEDVVATVFYYGGDYPFDLKHHHSIRYIVTAVAMLCVFGIVPPFLLVYPSLLKLLEWLTRHRLNLSRLYPHTKLQAFLDEFHGCYRDGTDGGMDCRWFAGFYFLLRLSLFVIFAQTNNDEQYTTQLLLFLFCSFLFLMLRPYRESWINQVDATIFLIMAGISATSLYNILKVWNGKLPSTPVQVIQYVLILLPLFYCTAYCFTLIYAKCKGNILRTKKIISDRESAVEITNDQDSDGESLVGDNSTHVPEFLDYVDSGRMKRLSHASRWRPTLPDHATSDDETRPLLSAPSTNTSGGTCSTSTSASTTTSTSGASGISGGSRSDARTKKTSHKVTHSTISIHSTDD